MTHQTVRYTKEEHVGELVLQRPEAQNTINQSMAEDVARIMAEIYGDEDVRALIISGAGEDFCVGTDMEALSSANGRAQIIQCLTISPFFHRFDRPVVAAINGSALGQGLELALACDLRVCGENSRFGLPQVSRGEIPWDGGTQRLSRLVGRGRALQMILTGEIIDAREARRIGLINWMVPDDEVKSKAVEVAREMAAKAPIALRFVKEAVSKGMDMTMEQGLRLE
ncbi:MAG: enoyl-CoA hydratase/isomerase family protein, partial [Deltaproteobacteria bacterium]|nr:enoyl-CoA hydratase/isomerase family protein [Deltaproteobacteria bacterium]